PRTALCEFGGPVRLVGECPCAPAAGTVGRADRGVRPIDCAGDFEAGRCDPPSVWSVALCGVTEAGGMKVAVLIPCHNEERTIGKVIADFRVELPDAEICVGDNNSTDRTAAIAEGAGARVIPVYRQGKGAVARALFREVDADVYILVDGDDTY